MKRMHWCSLLVLSALWLGACSTRTYDLVIANGRVMDPESGFDRVAHVGIVGNRIEAISDSPLRGNRSIDAAGLVVAPGFIEIHTHGEDALNYGFRAMDGVTTRLGVTERGSARDCTADQRHGNAGTADPPDERPQSQSQAV